MAKQTEFPLGTPFPTPSGISGFGTPGGFGAAEAVDVASRFLGSADPAASLIKAGKTELGPFVGATNFQGGLLDSHNGKLMRQLMTMKLPKRDKRIS